MESNSLKILIVEEQQSDIKLIESILKDSEIDFIARYAKTENEFIKYINRFQPEIIISGQNFSKFSVHEALDYIQSEKLMIPFILLVNKISDEILQDYFKKGVDDCITRFNLLQLPSMIQKAIEGKQLRVSKTKTEDLLKVNEARLKRFFENNPESIFELGFSCEILEMNPIAEEILNYRSKIKLRKLKFTECIHKEDLKAFREIHGMACRGQKKEFNFRLVNGKEEIVWIAGKLIPMYNEEDNIISVLLIGRNITDQKNGEEELLEAKKNYESVIQAIDQSIWAVNAELSLVSFNNSAVKIFFNSFKTKLKKGMSITQLHSNPSQYALWRDRYEEVIHSGKSITADDSYSVNGEQKFCHSTLYPIVLNNQVSGVSVISKDVTGEKFTDQQLRLSKESFQKLSDCAPVGIFKTDPIGNCTYVNERCSQIVGIPSNELIGSSWSKAIHPEDLEKVFEIWNVTVELGVEFNMEYRILANEKTVHVSGRAVSIKDAFNKITGFIGTVTDITAVKNAQDEIKEKQIILDAIENTSRFSFWTIENASPYNSYYSDSSYQIFESSKNQPLSIKLISEKVHPDDKFRFSERIKELTTQGKPMKIEYRICLSNGKIKHLMTNAFPVKDEKGIITKFIGATMDYTLERIDKEKLKDAELLLLETYEMTSTGSFEVVLESNTMIWSKELKKIIGIHSDDSPLRMDEFKQSIHPDDLGKFTKFVNKQLEKGKSDLIEIRLQVNGTTEYFVISCHGVFDTNNKMIKLVGLMMNVSQKINDLQKIERTEQMMKVVFDHSPDCLFIEDLNGLILDVNQKACEFQKMSKHNLVGKNIFDIAPEKYHDEFKTNFQNLCKGKVSEIKGYTWNAEGKEIPVEIKASLIQFNAMEAILLSVRDISKWVKQESPQGIKINSGR